ncbi:hypothetical protein [Rhizobium etli]|uniref:Methyl-accepting chemotaxis protein n=1 Tax=Rhizobium etli TaxID=29449 RepID=A0A7W6VEH5_RHIET|nr:hypothetical protein [Rhizobium etli]MBB4481819.1 hypothetical protein [Rhizobium etli]MBB4537648.1 hypothetical protein [Rhizobium etli]
MGAVGFYASSLLQGRMDISNSVLQSLSRFRNLSAAMAEFPANATQENRDAVTARLADQDRADHRRHGRHRLSNEPAQEETDRRGLAAA